MPRGGCCRYGEVLVEAVALLPIADSVTIAASLAVTVRPRYRLYHSSENERVGMRHERGTEGR